MCMCLSKNIVFGEPMPCPRPSSCPVPMMCPVRSACLQPCPSAGQPYRGSRCKNTKIIRLFLHFPPRFCTKGFFLCKTEKRKGRHPVENASLFLLCDTTTVVTCLYFSAGSMAFQMIAAKAPPTKGPTMKIHKLASAVPPWKMAGASERAGFTEVPV